MRKIHWMTFALFLLTFFIGSRVEWLNAQTGYPLPMWKSTMGNEQTFDRSQKLRQSILAADFFWDHPKNAEKLKLKDRSKLQKEARYWNNLLDFGLFALLQFPLLLVQGLLLVWWRCQKLTPRGNFAWWGVCGTTILLLVSAFYRDYTYGIYGA